MSRRGKRDCPREKRENRKGRGLPDQGKMNLGEANEGQMGRGGREQDEETKERAGGKLRNIKLVFIPTRESITTIRTPY